MTSISFDAVFVLRVVFAQRGLVQIIQLLSSLLLLRLHDRNWHVLSERGLHRLWLSYGAQGKVFSLLWVLLKNTIE